MQRTIRFLVAAALCTTAALAAAQGITGIGAVNRGPAEASDSSLVTYQAQFRSELSVATPEHDGNAVSFESRHAFSSGVRLEPWPLAAVIPIVWNNPLSYEISFRVLDPDQRGYELDIRSRLAGTLFGAGSRHEVELGTLQVEADTGSGFFLLDALSTTPVELQGVVAFEHAVLQTGAHQLGSFVGTRDFRFRVRTSDYREAYHETLLMRDARATTDLRFGLDPLRDDFKSGLYRPGEDPSGDGHFLRFTASFHGAAAPVPEPATWASLALGIGALLWRRRVRDTL